VELAKTATWISEPGGAISFLVLQGWGFRETSPGFMPQFGNLGGNRRSTNSARPAGGTLDAIEALELEVSRYSRTIY